MSETNESLIERPNDALDLFVTSDDLGLDGDYDATDISVPRFRILNKGDENFGVGTLVLDDHYRVKPPVKFIPIASTKDYIENLEMESEQTARIVKTKEEVEELGGDIVRRQKGIGKFTPRSRMILVIQADDEAAAAPDADAAYPRAIEIDGVTRRFALCMITLTRTAYESMAMPMVQTTQSSQKPYRAYFWLLTPKKITSSSGFSWYVPEVIRSTPVPEEAKEMVDSLYSMKESLYGLMG